MASPSSTYWESTSTPVPGWRSRISHRRLEPLVGVRGRHPDVDHRDVGLVAGHLEHQVVRVRAAADDLEARLRQQPGEALPQQRGVLGYDDAHEP